MRKITFFLSLLFFISNGFLALPAAAQTYETQVLVNGQRVESDVPALIVEDTTMLPFRAILNALGVDDTQIVWKPASACVQVRDKDTYIFLAVGNSAALVNQSMVTLSVAPFIHNDRMLVPVRFIAEGLGADVRWDDVAKIAHIKK